VSSSPFETRLRGQTIYCAHRPSRSSLLRRPTSEVPDPLCEPSLLQGKDPLVAVVILGRRIHVT